ncbi:MAG TPA: methylenetetrahydrofolate reductase C-terminal domain-containing protein [Ktedonobacteraceae bacterium]|nr:methylenetetrahydrofolate reductase C-terminal domain-containing protein [Ktedonobacteraceae bacterium]
MNVDQSSEQTEDRSIGTSESPVSSELVPTNGRKGRPLRVLANTVGKGAASEVGHLGNAVGQALLQCEKLTKEALFGCHMCGQCILQQTALICPMRCPKGMRNGPCGGPSLDGQCEVYPDRPCIWVEIYQRSERFGLTGRMEKLQWPVDWSLQGTSAYGNVLNGKWFTPKWSQVLDHPKPTLKAGTNLEHALNAGRFVITAELGPPRSANADVIRKKAELLRGKVAAINITDNSLGTARLSSLVGCLVLQEMGIEPILQMSCRDRNRIALQSELISAGALGIGNVLLLTGDHQRYGDDPEAMGVFDLDSNSLLALARRMRDNGELLSGQKIADPPRLLLGAAANPEGEPLDLQILRLQKKVAAGADFIQTQAVFDIDHFKQWMARVRSLGLHQEVKILVGILLLHSAERANFLREHVPGMRVSQAIVDRLANATDPKAEGKQMAQELIQSLAEIEGVAGIHVMTIAWEEAIPDVIEPLNLANASLGV